jgi:isopenicillin N synthase-like dioxygenase
MGALPMIPEIDVAPLFDAAMGDRETVDRRVWDAACRIGFMTIVGLPSELPIGPDARASLVRLFRIRGPEQRRLWKRNFAPENPNLYRGWWPIQSDETGGREGFDLGPDVVRALPDDGTNDPLHEPSVFPDEGRLPGWRADAAGYYVAMERIGLALLDALARGMGVAETFFRGAFRDGISSLRLVRYPARDAGNPLPPELDHYHTTWQGRRAEVVCGAHVDSGLVTIVAQCDEGGLQAKTADRGWVDVPAKPDALVVNFGALLERWTGGRVRATRHRVLSLGGERVSIPFFLEPRADARIEPLPLPDVEPFQPFLYGDHVWTTTTRFPENYGLGPLRPNRAPYADPFRDA